MRDSELKERYSEQTYKAFYEFVKEKLIVKIPPINPGEKPENVYDLKVIEEFEKEYFKSKYTNWIERFFKWLFIIIIPSFLCYLLSRI